MHMFWYFVIFVVSGVFCTFNLLIGTFIAQIKRMADGPTYIFMTDNQIKSDKKERLTEIPNGTVCYMVSDPSFKVF